MFDKETQVDPKTGDYEGKLSWPAYFYGPNGAAEVFNTADDVPEGWVDHPSKLDKAPAKGKQKAPTPPADSPYKDWDDAKVVEELKIRKIDYNDRWPRTKLEQLLLDYDAKQGQ